MAPSRIAGRYELKEQLGEGGMGVVWRALDTKTGSYVAIKLMKDMSDPVAVDIVHQGMEGLGGDVPPEYRRGSGCGCH